MGRFLFLFLLMLFVGCKNNSFVSSEETEEMIFYLDSISKMDMNDFITQEKIISDSIHKNQQVINLEIKPELIEELKNSIRDLYVSLEIIEKIPKIYQIIESEDFFNFLEENEVHIVLHKFDENKFAIEFPKGWESLVLFFDKNVLLSKHLVFHKYGLEIESFLDENQNVTIFYNYVFQAGTGVWESNRFFYTYSEKGLIPTLNELKTANFSVFYYREFQFQSEVTNTNPLTLKMVYNSSFLPKAEGLLVEIVKDSTEVVYRFDKDSFRFKADYSLSKLSEKEISSYYLNSNERLFINIYNKKLKELVLSNDTLKQNAVSDYLKDVKNGEYDWRIE